MVDSIVERNTIRNLNVSMLHNIFPLEWKSINHKYVIGEKENNCELDIINNYKFIR